MCSQQPQPIACCCWTCQALLAVYDTQAAAAVAPAVSRCPVCHVPLCTHAGGAVCVLGCTADDSPAVARLDLQCVDTPLDLEEAQLTPCTSGKRHDTQGEKYPHTHVTCCLCTSSVEARGTHVQARGTHVCQVAHCALHEAQMSMQDAHAAGSPHCRLLQEHTHRKAMFQQTRMQHLLAAQTWNRHAHPTCTGQSTPFITKMKRNQQPRVPLTVCTP